MAAPSRPTAALDEALSQSYRSSFVFSLNSPLSSFPSTSDSASYDTTQPPVTFTSPSLCPDSAEDKQLLVTAGLWSHYLHSISTLTHTFRQFTQRTLAAYKQLSHSSVVDSADLSSAITSLNTRYIVAHRTTLALYLQHANSSSHAHNDDETATIDHAAPSHIQAKRKPRIRAVRSLTSTLPAKSKKQREKSSGRVSFPTASTSALRVWFRSHLRSPYPKKKEKAKLSKASGMSVEQVANWFVNARMRLWRKYILEEREKVEEEKGKDEKETEENTEGDDDSQPGSKVITREQRMKKRARKRQAGKQEATAWMEGEREHKPSKKRQCPTTVSAATQPTVDKSTATPVPGTPARLLSPVSGRRSLLSFAPTLASTIHAIPSFCATFSSAQAASPMQLSCFSPSTPCASSKAPLHFPALPASSAPLFNFSSEPPSVTSMSAGYRTAAMFDFDMPATLTMSMTLPHSLQLPTVADSVDAGLVQYSQPMVVDAECAVQHDEVRHSITSVGLFTPPHRRSSQLLTRSLRLTFTATQWASLEQYVPVTPVLDRELEEVQATRRAVEWK